MGDIFSAASQPNSTATLTMSSSNHPQPDTPRPSDHPKTEESTATIGEEPAGQDLGKQESPIQETLTDQDSDAPIKDGEVSDEEEEEGECGFCLFMKGGGCKDTFVDWEKCVEEGEKNKEDIVEKCFQATAALKKCMEAHSDYYAPLLEAEKAAEEEVAKQLEEKREMGENRGGDDESGKKEKEGNLGGSDQKE